MCFTKCKSVNLFCDCVLSRFLNEVFMFNMDIVLDVPMLGFVDSTLFL